MALFAAGISFIIIPKRPDFMPKLSFLFTYSQWLSSLLLVAVFCGFVSLDNILIAVACAQFQKMKAAILDIRQQHITPHHVQENEQVHSTEYCNMQAMLNVCIRHHQEIIE